MLAQQHATAAHNARDEDGETEPPQRIETENERESQQGTDHTPDGCGMNLHLPTHINEGTKHLNEQRGNENAAHEMGNVQGVHRVIGGRIAHDGDDIGHHAPLFHNEIEGLPALIAPVEPNEKGGQQNGEEVDQGKHRELVARGKLAHIAEHKQGHQPHKGQIEWGKHHAHHPCGQDKIFLFHLRLCAPPIAI